MDTHPNFTDAVMRKIALEMAVREKRRTAWMTVLYIAIGVVCAAAIAVLLDYLDVIPFENYGTAFLNIFHSFSIEKQSTTSTISSVLNPVFSFISEHYIAAIVTSNLLILYLAGTLLSQKMQSTMEM